MAKIWLATVGDGAKIHWAYAEHYDTLCGVSRRRSYGVIDERTNITPDSVATCQTCISKKRRTRHQVVAGF